MIDKLIIAYNKEINGYIEIAKSLETEYDRIIYESAITAYRQSLDAFNKLIKKYIFDVFDVDYGVLLDYINGVEENGSK